MSILGLVVGTLVLWVLTYAVALPLSRGLAGTQASAALLPAIGQLEGAESGVVANQGEKRDAIDDVPAEAFILVHVLVLGLAGLLLGTFAGVWFVGFAHQGKMWPGMIALIVASLFGAFALH